MWHLDNENELFCGYIAVGLTICCSVTNRKYYELYNTPQKILLISDKLSCRDVFFAYKLISFSKNFVSS